MIKRLSEIKAEPYWGLGKDKRVSINDLIDKDIIFYDYKPLHDDKTKVIVKFSYEETESDFHTFITSSEVIADRLSKDRDKLPFIAAVKRRKKYTYYE